MARCLRSAVFYIFFSWYRRFTQVVLADSTVVSANAHEHPDLFYALKGGGSNFGTRKLDHISIPKSNLLTARRNRNTSRSIHETIRQNLLWNGSLWPFRNGQSSQGTCRPSTWSKYWIDIRSLAASNSGRFSVFRAYHEARSFLKVLHNSKCDDICPSDYRRAQPTYKNRGWVIRRNHQGKVSAERQKDMQPVMRCWLTYSLFRQDAVAASVMADGDLYIEMYRRGREMSKTLEEKTGTGLNLVFQQVSKTAVEKGHQLGKNPFGMLAQPQTCINLPPEILLLCWQCSGFTAAATWQDAAHDETVHEVLHDLGTSMKELADAKGLSNPQLFPNDSTFSQNPMESFGKQVLGELQATSRKFDPELVFQKLQNGGFKLGMV